MVVAVRSQKKYAYFDKLTELFESHQKILIVNVDHVGSKQMAEIRLALRGKAIVLMGKNTMMRTCLRSMEKKNAAVKNLIGKIRQNIGLIFCISDSSQVRQIVLNNKVPAPARQGAIAPVNVMINAGPTSLDPSQTSFFQALGISTKLVKGQIEIQTDVNIITTGEKVTASQSALLKKLNILPFNYGLSVLEVYDDGYIYNASMLDMTDEVVLEKFATGVQFVAGMSRELGLPNETSISYCISEGFKNCVAFALETDFVFAEMLRIKDILANPEAYAAAPPTTPAVADKKSTEQLKEKQQVDEEEEEDEEVGFSLFD